MPWSCPGDGAHLSISEGGGRCSRCDAEQPMVDGVLHLQTSSGGYSMPAAPFEALSRALKDKKGDAREAALATFCSANGYRRTLHGGDWKLLLPVDSDSTVLEIGPGLGEVTVELASRARELVTLVSNPHAAALVQSQIVAGGGDNVSVAFIPQLERLPLADDSVDSIAVSEAGLLGFALAPGGLAALAAELRRVARPDATLLIGQSNPLYRMPGVAALRSRMKSGKERSIEAALQRATIPAGAPRWGRSAIVSALTGAGFGEPNLFAPIPDEESAMAVLPVTDRTVVRYFLGHLVRRNALPTRAALAVLRPIVALGQFWRVVPYWYLVFER